MKELVTLLQMPEHCYQSIYQARVYKVGDPLKKFTPLGLLKIYPTEAIREESCCIL